MRRSQALALGEEQARQLGVETEHLKVRVILFTSLITVAAVSVSGIIGFVGLVIPLIAGRLVGRIIGLLPAAGLLGAIFLVWADTLARGIGEYFRVGVLTSLLGVPFFFYLLKRRPRVPKIMLEALSLTLGYDDRTVLPGVSLTAARGQFIGLVGPNGSGKSTLVRALSRVLPPQRGQVLLDGLDIYRMSARALARRLAVVAQDNTVHFDFSVREVVLMGRPPHLSRFGIERPHDYAVVEECLSATSATALAERPITALSGGERQRCAIARALAQEPEILILDEPTAHLDINHQIEVLDLTRRLTVTKGLATLVVLHDLNLASQYCDALVLLAGGRSSRPARRARW